MNWGAARFPPSSWFCIQKNQQKQEARKDVPLFLLDFICGDGTERTPQTAKAAIHLIINIIAISTKKSSDFCVRMWKKIIDDEKPPSLWGFRPCRNEKSVVDRPTGTDRKCVETVWTVNLHKRLIR